MIKNSQNLVIELSHQLNKLKSKSTSCLAELHGDKDKHRLIDVKPTKPKERDTPPLIAEDFKRPASLVVSHRPLSPNFFYYSSNHTNGTSENQLRETIQGTELIPSFGTLSLSPQSGTKSPPLSKLSLTDCDTTTEMVLQSKKNITPKLSLDSALSHKNYAAVDVHPQPATKMHCAGDLCWRPEDSPKTNMMSIVWFHPNLNRHQAEAELTNSKEGVYLLRPRMDGHICKGYALDVRSTHSVKHFQVNVAENGDIILGKEHFNDLDSFQEHFNNIPLFRDETGLEVVCRYPYPREVDDAPVYSLVTEHFVPNKSRSKQIETISKPRVYSLASKEGFLVKVGQRVKSWKRRWFVLNDVSLHYYATEKDTKPIRTISLKEATKVSMVDIQERPNSFQLVLPERTFYIQAPSYSVMEDWVHLIQFKLDEVMRLEQPKQKQTKYICKRLFTK